MFSSRPPEAKRLELSIRRPTLIGVVHLLPLPGSPRHREPMEGIVERALADGRALLAGGMDGVLVENYGDAPFFPERVPPETVAALAVCARELARALPCPVGVNCLRNDARAALGIAVAAGASFIRVNVHTGAYTTDQGILEGRAHETLRARAALASEVKILADVHVKHAEPIGTEPIGRAARDAAERGLADALVVTGPATGAPVDLAQLRAVRDAVPDRPVLAGSGVDAANARSVLSVADGAIVGSALEEDGRAGNPVVLERVRALVSAVREPARGRRPTSPRRS